MAGRISISGATFIMRESSGNSGKPELWRGRDPSS
jgi:hypothetical protein